MSDWAAAWHRGELALFVLTRSRAELDRIPMRAEAELVGLIIPDGLPNRAVGFVSEEALHVFCREMAPHRIIVAGVESEADRALLLQAALERAAADGRLH